MAEAAAAAANTKDGEEVPGLATDAVLFGSVPMPADSVQVKGYDFNDGVDFNKLMASYLTTGYQSTNLGLAIEQVQKMIDWRLSDEPVGENESDEWQDPVKRAATKCTIFFSYTSNLISSGLRETIRFLAQHRMVDVIVSSAGGIEEDFIKCLGPTYLGRFDLDGATLRAKGHNRIGNLLVPNENYQKFEDWLTPILDEMLKEQNREKDPMHWTPSKMIHRLGKEINHPDSVYYWAYKNNIPVFCPSLTDGSIGDMLYFHSYRSPGLILDIVEDIRLMNDSAMNAKKTGMIILGGGLVKHHVCNANLMRNGADFAVFINTAQEFDGSDAGARPDEAISWGKIRLGADPVKLYAEATLVFPLIVAQTFAKLPKLTPVPEESNDEK